MIKKIVWSAVCALLGAVACGSDPDPAAPPDDGLSPEHQLAVDASLDHLGVNAARYGFAGRDDLKLAKIATDDLELTHARFQQTIGGVPVFGGEGIVHLTKQRAITAVSDAFVPGVALDTVPDLTADQAIGEAIDLRTCASCLAAPPASDLWVLRHAGRDHLVWRVQLRIDDGKDPAMPVLFIDAHDGSLVWEYDNLQTGSGPSLYSGPLTFDTTLHTGTFYLEDIPRKLGTFDMRNGTGATPFHFDDADDIWDAAAQRAGIDAHYGANTTWEYFKNVHGRNGIDGAGGPNTQLAIDGTTRLITSRVHYSTNYNNAFWDGQQMTYGDGNGVQFSPLVTLDVAGHEMMHGVTQHSAGLIYQGESGALNESYSDVFGALVERYARGESPAIWLIGDECYTPATPGDALRHMDAPHAASNKGFTADDDPDHYSERYTGGSDNGGVHINSGIANKTFYLLAQGGAHHLGGSMTGIGADKAAAIWYKALTEYMTTSTNFVRAGRATYDAAVALFGDPSVEVTAVKDAWAMTGIVVDLLPPATAITAPADGETIIAPTVITASATDNVGVASVQFLINGAVAATDTASPFSFTWQTAGISGPRTIASKAFDAAGNTTASAPITVIVDNEAIPPVVAIAAPAGGATVANTVTVDANATDNVAVARVELLVDGVLRLTDTSAPYSFAWSSLTVSNGPHTLAARAVDTVGNAATSAPVQVVVDNDHTPPVVAITAPAAGAVVENTVTIEASATDNVGVARVEFYAGGTLLGSDTSAPYSIAWNTHSFGDGNHVLLARAWDALNNFTSTTVTVTVDNDSIPPAVAITAPADGAAVTGTVAVTATASDNVGVTRVELHIDGELAGSDTSAPYELSWNTLRHGNGAHAVRVRAFDALNNASDATVTVTANNPNVATYDTALKAPRCAAETAICDTGAMIDGRGSRGPEPRAPNTIGATCADGAGGTYHVTESLDRLRVFTADGLPIAAGKPVTIEATVWSGNSSLDAIDLFSTTTPSAPVWTLITTLAPPTGAGERVASTTFTLPPGAQQAIRAQYRASGAATSTCWPGTLNDRDDLVFAVVDVPDTAPPVTAITAPAAGAELSGVAAITATASDNVGVIAVELYVDGTRVATDAALPYSFAWATTTVSDGPHTLVTRAIDPAGNIGESAPIAITVDNEDVTAPAAAITSPAPGATISGNRTISATASDNIGVVAVEFYADGALIATDTSSPYSAVWATATVPNGAHTLQARARDLAGNAGDSAPVAVTVQNIDSTLPAVSLVSPAAGEAVSGIVAVHATATDNVAVASVEFYIDSAKLATVTAPPYLFAWDSTTKANGPHTVRARAIDTSGNATNTSTITVIVGNVDVTPPAVSITSPAAGAVIVGTRTISAAASDLEGVVAVEIYLDGALIATDTASPYSTSWNTTTAPNGPHTLQGRARDAAGNVGLSAPITVTVNNPDHTSPTTSITSPAQGALVQGTITVTTASSDNVGVAAVELLLDGTKIATVTAPPFNFTWDTKTAANRLHTLRTRALDAAGNSSQSAPLSITIDNGIGVAAFDATLQAPRCAVGYDGCDSGALLSGRGGVGPEQNAPNTLHDACGDGGSGGFHTSESIDRLRVYTTDGTPLASGAPAVVEVTFWNWWNLLELDVVDLYYTTSPASPSWIYIGSITPNSPQGMRVVTASYTLPSGTQHAIRANLRRRSLLGANTPSTCTGGAFNDHDDLVFTVGGP